LTRPPLIFTPQQKTQFPQVDRYPNLSITTLTVPGTPKVRQQTDSAPTVIQRPQVDVYPNLLETTFRNFSPLQAGTLSTSAPYRAPPPGIDVYSNLLETTLKPPGTPSFLRATDSAPQVRIPPQVDVYPNLITNTLFPVPFLLGVGRIDASAPYKAPSLGVQPAPPNLLETTLTPVPPNLTGRRWDWPAPVIIKRPQVDIYPNLLGTTLKRPGTPPPFSLDLTRLPAATAAPKVDAYPNLLTTTLQPTPTPPTIVPTTPVGRYLSGPTLTVELQTGQLFVVLSKGIMYCQLSHAGYVA
jgi:hypothetical protein